ncbi:hypothetical protein Tco_0383143 [Tanacetum coccineum]
MESATGLTLAYKAVFRLVMDTLKFTASYESHVNDDVGVLKEVEDYVREVFQQCKEAEAKRMLSKCAVKNKMGKEPYLGIAGEGGRRVRSILYVRNKDLEACLGKKKRMVIALFQVTSAGKVNVVVKSWSRKKSEAKIRYELLIDVCVKVIEGRRSHLGEVLVRLERKDKLESRGSGRRMFLFAVELLCFDLHPCEGVSKSLAVGSWIMIVEVGWDSMFDREFVSREVEVLIGSFWKLSFRQDLGFIPSGNVVLSSTYVGKILGADQLLVILCPYRGTKTAGIRYGTFP